MLKKTPVKDSFPFQLCKPARTNDPTAATLVGDLPHNLPRCDDKVLPTALQRRTVVVSFREERREAAAMQTVVLLCGFVLVSVVCGWGWAEPGHVDVGYPISGEGRCPRSCSCSGSTVDCSRRGLTQVPRNIPFNTERL